MGISSPWTLRTGGVELVARIVGWPAVIFAGACFLMPQGALDVPGLACFAVGAGLASILVLRGLARASFFARVYAGRHPRWVVVGADEVPPSESDVSEPEHDGALVARAHGGYRRLGSHSGPVCQVPRRARPAIVEVLKVVSADGAMLLAAIALIAG